MKKTSDVILHHINALIHSKIEVSLMELERREWRKAWISVVKFPEDFSEKEIDLCKKYFINRWHITVPIVMQEFIEICKLIRMNRRRHET
jgi:hypothetical protein